MPVIVDCFLFNDEFDMLHARLEELGGVVDAFIAIEADHTMAGEPKPYWLSAGRGLLDQSTDLAVLRVETANALAEGFSQEGNWVDPRFRDAWARETKQRNAADDYIRGLPADTIVLMGDVDEIPRRSVVENFNGPPSCLMMVPMVYSTKYCLNGLWHGSYIAKVGEIRPRSSTEARISRSMFPKILDAGWHLSWFGSPEDRVRKIHSFSHRELCESIGDRVATELPTKHIHVDGVQELIEYHGDLPVWVAEGHAPPNWTRSWE